MALPEAVHSTQSIINIQIMGNNIKHVGSTDLKFLQTQLRTFAGSGNPYSCGCDMLSYTEWIQSIQITISDNLGEYKCAGGPMMIVQINKIGCAFLTWWAWLDIGAIMLLCIGIFTATIGVYVYSTSMHD